MEEDNELLDWGHEEDEHQEALRRSSYDLNGRRDYGDADDVEDAVSLGEDEDDQDYYQHQDANRTAHDTGITQDAPERPPAQARGDGAGANGQQRFRHSSNEGELLERPATQNPRISTGSPPRQRTSRNRASPQRSSNHSGARLTHALPPKPVTVPSAYLSLSHPSIVEAVGMASISPGRTTARDAKKQNGTPEKPGSPPLPAADLPQNWEQRYSRRGGDPYYYNRETFVSTRIHPVSSIPSTSSYGRSHSRRRRRSASSGNMHITPPDSHHSQTSRSSHERIHPQPDMDLDEAPKIFPSNADGLSYKDRHYRPGGDASALSVEIRTVDHTEVLSARLPSKSRYGRSPENSPTRRRRARSDSPPPDARATQIPPRDRDYQPLRGNGRPSRGRERNVYSNPDSAMSRDLEVIQPEPGYSDRHWVPSPHLPLVEVSKNEHGSRLPPQRTIDEDEPMLDQHSSDNRNRSRRRESSRGLRKREPRPADRREKVNEQQFLSAPRYRSPPRTRERDLGRDYGPQQEPEPHTGRRDKPGRFENPSNGTSASVSRPAREPVNARPRDYEALLPSNFVEQPRRDRREDRGNRDYDRYRRDPALNDKDIPRREDVYPATEANRSSNERPKRFNDGYDQPPLDESTHRRRAPLPPQAKTFLSSSSSGSIHRDLPPHTLPDWPKRATNVPRDEEPPKQQERGHNNYPPPRIDTRMDIDYNNAPKSSAYPPPYEKLKNIEPPREYYEQSGGPRSSRLAPPPRPSGNSARTVSPNPSGHRGPDSARHERGPPARSPPSPGNFDDRRSRDTQEDDRPGLRDSRPVNLYHERNPPRHEYRDRPDDVARPLLRGPPAPVSGTNNVPIGTRRPPASLPPPPSNLPPPVIPSGIPGPPTLPFNPGARPPSSTLIDPAKARDLLPPGKESYERPPHLMPHPPHRLRSPPDHPRRDPPPHVPQRTQQTLQHPAPGGDESKRRRESRFSAIEPKTRVDQPTPLPPDRQRGQDISADPVLARSVSPTDIIEMPPTPPPISREPSTFSVTMENTSSRLSDQGQTSDGRSDISRGGPSRYSEQRQDLPRSGRFSDGLLPSAPISHPYRQDPSASSLHHATETAQDPDPPSKKSIQQRGFSRWGDNAATSGQVDPPSDRSMDDTAPALSRRLSSERPPRHRKYPSGSGTFVGPDQDIRGSESVDSVYAPPEGRQLQEDAFDVDDRLERSSGDAPVSLLARLSTPLPDRPSAQDMAPQSLRDRLVPSKRDREDMMMEDRNPRDPPYDADEGNESKRARRRNPKSRRGGRRYGT